MYTISPYSPSLPLDEYVVFINPTQLQRDIFNKILTADKLDNLVRNSTAESLALIGMLTKVSNSPILLKAAADKAKAQGREAEGEAIKRNVFAEAAKLLPERAQVEDVSLSGLSFPVIMVVMIAEKYAGKLIALANLLRVLFKVRSIAYHGLWSTHRVTRVLMRSASLSRTTPRRLMSLRHSARKSSTLTCVWTGKCIFYTCPLVTTQDNPAQPQRRRGRIMSTSSTSHHKSSVVCFLSI